MSSNGHDMEVVYRDPPDRPPVHDGRPRASAINDESKIKGFFDFPADEQKSLQDYFWSILNRKWTIVAVFLVGLAISGFVVYTSTPYYISTAIVEINKLHPRSSSVSDLFAYFNQYDIYYQSQITALKSRGLAERFLEQMKSVSGVKPKVEPDKPSESSESSDGISSAKKKVDGLDRDRLLAEERQKSASINSVLGRVTVVPIRGTQMIEVKMGGSDPLRTREMLDEYLKTFIQMSQEKRDHLGTKMKKWLSHELVDSERRLKESEKELLDFTKQHDIVVFDSTPNPQVGEFERAGRELNKSVRERLKLESLEYQKERILPGQMADGYLKTLQGRLAEQQAEYTAMKGIYSPNYWKMITLENKIRATEQAIAELEKNTLSSALEAAKKQEAASKEKYEKAKEDAIGKNSLAVKYSILKKAVEANEKLYLMLLQRSKQAEIDHGIMGHQIVVASAPTLPLSPVKPRKGRIMLVGAVLGLLGGIVLAFCLELVDNTVQSTQEIQDRLNLPILGAVPILQREKDLGDVDAQLSSLEFMAYRFPASPFTDAIRIVENTASAFMPQESGSSMVVTSALPLEGKTLISVVMGTVVASERKKVLVIDGDMRNPRIHKVFQSRADDVGLSDLLTGKTLKLKEAIRQSHVPGLYYMPAGFIPDNPVALLKTKRINDILEACKKVFDAVILDAPPILGLVDARILAGNADGIILVTRAGHTPIEVLREAKDAVYQGQGRLLGIVLNMADRRKGYGSSYYSSRYYNRYYHRYYHREGKPSRGNGDSNVVDA